MPFPRLKSSDMGPSGGSIPGFGKGFPESSGGVPGRALALLIYSLNRRVCWDDKLAHAGVNGTVDMATVRFSAHS